MRYFTTLVLLIFSTDAFSCSCVAYAGSEETILKQAYARSDIIFVGSVFSEKADPNEFDLGMRETEFRVSMGIKGEPLPRITTKIWAGCCACGYDFNVGQIYLVFANKHPEYPGLYTASTCSLTSRYNESAQKRFRWLAEKYKVWLGETYKARQSE